MRTLRAVKYYLDMWMWDGMWNGMWNVGRGAVALGWGIIWDRQLTV